MKQIMSKKQPVFFLALSVVLAGAALGTLLASPKNPEDKPVVPATAPAEDMATPVNTPETVAVPLPNNSDTATPSADAIIPAPETLDTTTSEITPPVVPEATLTATLHAGETSIVLAFTDGQTLLEALSAAQNSGQISFTGKQHSGLGFYITDIGTLHESPGKYLVYYINGQSATLGVSTYTPKNSDVIDWKLE
ncbi:DUF4430 domain-containing protein [Candidatus Gottesmanbacteria bacterium]|nr:DUF4430 domain-containing protein [Candidatus Gottesmanbacteria bacterium]